MIHLRDEGEPVKNGLSFYPLKSKNSAGMVLRFGVYALWLRYSKIRNRVSCSLQRRCELV